MDETIVSTGEYKQRYEVLGVVSFYHATIATKTVFDKDLHGKDLFNAIIEKLKEEAKEMGADAISYLRCEFIPSAGTGFAISGYYLMYGTAIKFLQV